MKSVNQGNEQNIEVIGIGNAIVDIVVQVDDSFLAKNKLTKGSMTLIGEEQAKNLYTSLRNKVETSGGSVANTIAGLSQLGSKAAFVGRVKNDSLGKIFKKEMQSTGTLFTTISKENGPSTALCIVLVTADAQRTMCTYLGASIFLDSKDLDPLIIEKSKVLYLEGYLWDNEIAKRAFIQASEIAKLKNKKVALSLSDSFCVERHRESFTSLIESYVDILFANEDEIKSLYNSNDLEDSIKKARERCEVLVITLGAIGSLILSNGKTYKISAYDFGKTIDTTGAGDLYASGFLHGYTNKKDLITCGKIGSICAGHIVTQFGARANISLSDLVKTKLT